MGSLNCLLLLCVVFSSSFAGFRLGSTVRSETKGIWMWCVPHPSKPDRTLVLLDTEGLGDVEKVRQKVTEKYFLFWVLSLSLHEPRNLTAMIYL